MRTQTTRIYADTTVAYLEQRLAKVIGAQPANARGNAKYRSEVARLRRAIAARKAA